jgi:DNA-binding transcriptional ArsR family regulator
MQALTVSAERDVFDPNSRTFEERRQELQEQEKREKEALKRDKNSPFSRWTQYNLEHTRELMWLTLKHPKAQAILFFLVDQMDEYNAVMCSYQVIQEVLGVGQATVARNIRVLKENNFITVLKSGSSNVYAINDSVYWKSWGNKKMYSKFPANVVLSLSEQEETYQQLQFDFEITKHKEISINEKKDKIDGA